MFALVYEPDIAPEVVKLEDEMFDKVLLAPLIVLLVNVSEVALPTIVSVVEGKLHVFVLSEDFN
jgi:hypothetical protein